MSDDLTPAQSGNDSPLQTLIAQLRDLVRNARANALRAVDAIQVRTCWEIGRHIVEFEQGGAARAEYGKRLLPKLAESLTAEFGRGFDATNLRHMRGFFLAFPICDALRRELSWTHYRLLLRVDNAEARQWYVNEEWRRTKVPEHWIGRLARCTSSVCYSAATRPAWLPRPMP